MPGHVRNLYQDATAVLRARWYLRSAEELGERCRVWGRPAVDITGTLRIGPRLQLISTVWRTELAVAQGGLLDIGDRVFVNAGSSIGATELIRIGDRCSIGRHVQIMDSDWHRLEPERRDERPPSAPVIIEDDVWVANGSYVLRGVTIGAGSVVAAGSIVVDDVPPRSLVAGSPARVVRNL